MLGAYIGDIVGSIYEFNNIKTKDFPLFQKTCTFTDDSVLTCAVAMVYKWRWETTPHEINREVLSKKLVAALHIMGQTYPHAGYGGRFYRWLKNRETEPYNSFGNGAAMRCSSAGWFAESLEQAMELGEISAAVTHNHPEGIKGARITAGCIYLARQKESKKAIRDFAAQYYNLNFTLDEIRPTYDFDVTCQGTVPQAIVAFLESVDFEDALRNAISLGGDSDTLAAITGSIAEPFYGIPQSIVEQALPFISAKLREVL